MRVRIMRTAAVLEGVLRKGNTSVRNGMGEDTTQWCCL